MRYDPKAAQQPGGTPGTYYFTVATATEGPSKQGNDMITLTLAVDGQGQSIQVFDYIVNTPGGLWKAKMFCAEVGLDFDSGDLSAQSCIGKSGRVVLDYQKSDLAKVESGELERAYLKVMRYGVHGEKKANTQSRSQPSAPAPTPQPQAAAGAAAGSDIPF